MIPLSGAELAAALGAPAGPSGTFTGEVRIDSRAVQPGDLFVALRGERVDGHDFVDAVLAAGAYGCVVERPVEGQLVVPDTLAALQSLARHVFAREQPLTFGITGSSGKTSTKDLLAQVLVGFGETLAPVGSFNNEIGLPLTATQRTPTTRYAALEYSARGIGHIAFLCGIVRPQVAVVLNVGTAHIGEFGSRENIALAKGELVEAAQRLAVLNADDPLVLGMADRAGGAVVTYGAGTDADYRVTGIEIDDEGRSSFTLHGPTGSAPVRLAVRGEHQVANALAVAAAVLAAGVTDDIARVAQLLSEARPVSRWRMEVTDRADGVTIVNDAYNANPDSMRAALKTLAVMSKGKTRRTWAVLGEMAELGSDAREAHMDLGRLVVRLDVSRLVVVGPGAGGIHAGAVLEGSWGEESVHVEDADAAIALLREQVRPGDVVLVKASRSVGLERVAAALLGGPA